MHKVLTCVTISSSKITLVLWNWPKMDGRQVVSVHTTLIYAIFVTDQIKSNEVDLEFCPTKYLITDVYTKPLQGTFFANSAISFWTSHTMVLLTLIPTYPRNLKNYQTIGCPPPIDCRRVLESVKARVQVILWAQLEIMMKRLKADHTQKHV